MKREINMCKIEGVRKENRSGVNAKGREGQKKEQTIITDPLGSWTGVVADEYFDIPVQDVDDL